MGKYMFEVSYTQSGIQGIVKEGATSRKDFIDKLIANLGGSMESFYFTFGERDVIAIGELPDDATAAAISLAAGASGAVSIKTTVLIDASTMDEATQKSTGYRPPGA